jgi:putative ABC transport system permease protein
MGSLVLVGRLAAKDLRRRPAQAVLLLLAIAAATTTLTLGLALHGVTSNPYSTTRAATNGPDVVVAAFPPATKNVNPDVLKPLENATGVTGHSGPYPVTWALLRSGRTTAGAMIEGREEARAGVDRPVVTAGTWLSSGGAVVERAFADALGVHVGDRVTLNGRSLPVVGIAVTAAIPPYPDACGIGCVTSLQLSKLSIGLIWLPISTVASLATPTEPLAYFLNLKLNDPSQASAFANGYDNSHTSISAPSLTSWQDIATDAGKVVSGPQTVLLVGSWLLALLAVASVAVLVGGRMAEQNRRVGLLKAVGATPGMVAAVLLFEHLVVAVVAAAGGLIIGVLLAPLLTNPGAGLLGTAGAPSVNASTVGIVLALALAVAALATLAPALRAARTSTVSALNDAARTPRRSARLIAVSARLPVPLLLGLRLAARRPRRVLLGTLSVAVAVGGIVAVLSVHAHLAQQLGSRSGLVNPQTQRLNQVMLVITIMVVALAAINALLITWATVLDARHATALERALGASPEQVSVGLSAAQILPAIPGSLLGIPLGIGLYAAVAPGGITIPPVWWYAVVVVASWVVLVGLTALPARIGARRSVVQVLQAELA